MTTLQQITDSAVKEFDEQFKCIQCNGDGHSPIQTSDGEWEDAQCEFHGRFIEPIKSHLISSIKKAVEEAYKEIKIPAQTAHVTKPYEVPSEMFDIVAEQTGLAFQEALSLIEKKKSLFLNNEHTARSNNATNKIK